MYAVLAYLLDGPWPRHRSSGTNHYLFGLLFVPILAIAVGQEDLRLLYQSALPGADEWLDIAVK